MPMLLRSRELLIGAMLVACVVAVQLAYALQPYPSDQTNYFKAADRFPAAPENLGLTHQYLRIGLVVPVRLAIEVFGYSEAAYYAVPVLTAALLTASVFALGSLLFSRWVGAAAALLMVSTASCCPT